MSDRARVKGRLDPAKLKYVSGPRSLATNAEVDNLERELETTMPPGYREFVTTIGEGLLGLTFSIFAPWNVLTNRAMGAAQLEPWRWESGETGIGSDVASSAIWVIAGHYVGHVYFHPSNPDRLVHFPLRGGTVLTFDGHLYDFFDWALTGGIVRSPRRHQFEAGTSREVEKPDPKPLPRPSWEPDLTSPPRLSDEPAQVLAAYFAELCAVERWATEAVGGPGVFSSPRPPRFASETDDEVVAMTGRVQARYMTPTLARAVGGGSVTMSSTPEHDPAKIAFLSTSAMGANRVALETSELFSRVPFRHRYILDRTEDGWRISAIRHLGVIE